ncbi:MAG: hypothetical protein K0S12_1193 [Bacteroidetes bacterium]|jgi:hypothetical protein|nr:hypothetical protein [Bacteroidota bacterium]
MKEALTGREEIAFIVAKLRIKIIPKERIK